jgi:hypothetical protein
VQAVCVDEDDLGGNVVVAADRAAGLEEPGGLGP